MEAVCIGIVSGKTVAILYEIIRPDFRDHWMSHS